MHGPNGLLPNRNQGITTRNIMLRLLQKISNDLIFKKFGNFKKSFEIHEIKGEFNFP